MSKEKYSNWNNVYKPVLFYGSLTGILTGLVLFGFRLIAEHVLSYSHHMYAYVRTHLYTLPIFFGILAFLAYMVSYFIKKEANAGGGSIPRAAGFVRGILSFKWFSTLIYTMISTLFVFFSGLPLGMEGASVLIGTSISGGVSDIGKAKASERRYVLTSGASAGFSFATGSLMAAIVFPLEEMHKRFSWMLLTATMSGAIFSTLVVRALNALLGHETGVFFPIGSVTSFPISFVWISVIIGILIGLLASFFNESIERSGEWILHHRNKITQFMGLLINFLIVGIIGLIVIQNIGNGHQTVIIDLFLNSSSWHLGLLVLLLFAKIITIVLSSAAGATGGLFVPVLAIGALFGGILNIAALNMGLPATYSKALILIAMSAFFATSMDAPITTLLFIVEASLHVETTLHMVVAMFSGMLVFQLFHAKPLNEIVLKRFMKQQDRTRAWRMYDIEGIVGDHTFVVGKPVRDILWPANCMITALIQKDATNKANIMVHGGDRVLNAEDKIVFQIQSFDIDHSILELTELIGQQDLIIHDITKTK